MDGEIFMDLDDDRMDEDVSFELPLELPSTRHIPLGNTNCEVQADYIDYAKLESEFQNPALSYRLLHMFEVCPNRRVDIAKAIDRCHKLNNFLDLDFYRRFLVAIEKYKVNDPSASWPKVDTTWSTNAEEAVNSSIERELNNLKKAQDEGIKENIRIAMTKLFDVYYTSGKFYDAAKLYSRSLRDYCSAPKTLIPMLLSHVKALMFMQDFHRVETYLNQAERAIQECQDRENPAKFDRNHSMFPRDEKASKATVQQALKELAKVHAIMGVTKMAQKHYSIAADKFVSVDHEVFECPDLLSNTDIAYYGCFCGLASYTRGQLQEKILNNGNFRKFMEPEGKLVDLIQAFRSNSFTTVFQLLEEMRPYLLMNLYMAPHQPHLYSLIRRRAFVQYISTFGVISLPIMAKVFRTDTKELIDELIELIDVGILEARIDPIEEKLYRFEDDPVAKNSRRIAEIHQDLEERVTALVMRAALSYHGVIPCGEFQDKEGVSGIPGRSRRRAAPFMDDEYDEDDGDDVDMETPSQQLPFNLGRGGGNVFHRFMNKLTGGNKQPSTSGQNPPPVYGIGNTPGASGSRSSNTPANDSNVSDPDDNEN